MSVDGWSLQMVCAGRVGSSWSQWQGVHATCVYHSGMMYCLGRPQNMHASLGDAVLPWGLEVSMCCAVRCLGCACVCLSVLVVGALWVGCSALPSSHMCVPLGDAWRSCDHIVVECV
eukprot:9414229-Alexandrium_andersonii.AAC.1